MQQRGPAAYRYIHLDVFTDRRLEGNQLFVFGQPAGLTTEAMQALTRESNLSECTFVFPPELAGTDHRVRIFGRTAEMPFAGHPTIGTAFALAHTGVLKPGLARTTFGLGVGPINLDLDWKDGKLAFAWMTQLKPTFGKTIDDGRGLAAAIGVETLDPRAPAQEVNCGSNFMIVPLPTRSAVDAAVIDAQRSTPCSAAGVQRRGMYIFTTERGRTVPRLQPTARHRRGGRSRHRLGRGTGRRVHGEARVRHARRRRLDRVHAGCPGPPPEPPARARDDERRRGDRHQGRWCRGGRRRGHHDTVEERR